MARFVILRHEDTVPARDQPPLVVIRDGWALIAFIVPLFWLLWHRLWFAALIVLALGIAIALLVQDPQWATIGLPLNLLLGVYVGLEGQNWRIGRAQKRGYHVIDIVQADNAPEAELRFAGFANAAPTEPMIRPMVAPGRGEAPDFLFAPPGGAHR